MKIGDRVRVIGPSGTGERTRIGESFEITEAWKNDREMEFSAYELPWFPESSLELVDAPSDEEAEERMHALEKTSGDILASIAELGELLVRFDDRLRVLEAWQAEHDLEKSSRFPRAEQPLQVGDWVEVTRKPDLGLITEICGRYVAFYINDLWYDQRDLRKLEPDEIARRLNK